MQKQQTISTLTPLNAKTSCVELQVDMPEGTGQRNLANGKSVEMTGFLYDKTGSVPFVLYYPVNKPLSICNKIKHDAVIKLSKFDCENITDYQWTSAVKPIRTAVRDTSRFVVLSPLV